MPFKANQSRIHQILTVKGKYLQHICNQTYSLNLGYIMEATNKADIFNMGLTYQLLFFNWKRFELECMIFYLIIINPTHTTLEVLFALN